MRFMTERFRVYSTSKMPLTQIPPQVDFITAMPEKAKVKLLSYEKQPVGFLFPSLSPLETKSTKLEKDVAVCTITKSFGHPTSTFPKPGVESFLCEVTMGVDVAGFKSEVVVKGPRLVEVSKVVVGKDGSRTVKLDIVEMYLAGYDEARESLITVKGGKNLGLPPLHGEIKPLSRKSDFPASLYFDLELEVIDWATEQSERSL